MAIEIVDVRGMTAEERGRVEDQLHARAVRDRLLVRQRPTEAGVYEVSDGKAFWACPVVIDADALAKRRDKHARAGHAEG